MFSLHRLQNVRRQDGVSSWADRETRVRMHVHDWLLLPVNDGRELRWINNSLASTRFS